MIRAVILDLGRVIVPFEFDRAWSRAEALSGVPAAEIRRRVLSSGLVEDFESGRIDSLPFAQKISELTEIRVSLDEFAELWSSIFLPHTLISEGLAEGLSLRYPLVLLSNTNPLHFEMLRENYPILRHFHRTVLSYEVGAMKPSPEIYRKAVAATGFGAGECFFTDDVAAYVEGAQREGIDAVQFTGQAALETELRKRGICWGAAPGPVAPVTVTT